MKHTTLGILVTLALGLLAVAYLRDPAHSVGSGVGISNGFASQTPYADAASVPAGTTAITRWSAPA